MMVTVFVTLAVLGAIVAVVVMFVQRGRETLDLSLRGLLRVYLYVASLAGVIVFAVGVAGILSFVLAAAFGRDLVYGGSPPQPVPQVAPACPPGQPTCAPTPVVAPRPLPDERERRQQEDLVRGITFVVFGAVFWIAHWMARRGRAGGSEHASGLYRAYLMLGTAMFGIATIVLLPTGIYQALADALIAPTPNTFRQGAGDSLSGGLASLPIWLLYLWLVLRAIRAPAAPSAAA
ncbi:MAG TPA: DUF5671 domain-containing protein [Candidatus Acidoferrales bacterium]|nr:DUF5671 domain-containing protein [Candidatus Acidoferrales bacterium]